MIMTIKNRKNMSKKLFLISSYCDTKEKLDVLRDNLILLNNLNVDTLLLSPIEVSDDIINLTTYFFHTKENPVTTISEKTYIFWKKINDIKLERFFPDYGWADLYQRKKLSQIALTFDYDLYYHIIYDTKIDYNIIQEIHGDKCGSYYSNRATTGDINDVSLHFLPLNRQQLKSFEEYITKESYVTSHDLVHQYLIKWFNHNNFTKSEVIVDEYINYYGDEDIFSLIQDNDLKLFFEKDELNNKTNSFILYGENQRDVTLIINDEIQFNSVKMSQIIDSKMYYEDIKKIEIIIDGLSIDCTRSYNKIGRNKIV